MEVWKAAVLGIVQGITEFLPVSSSGHLILFERMLGAETGARSPSARRQKFAGNRLRAGARRHSRPFAQRHHARRGRFLRAGTGRGGRLFFSSEYSRHCGRGTRGVLESVHKYGVRILNFVAESAGGNAVRGGVRVPLAAADAALGQKGKTVSVCRLSYFACGGAGGDRFFLLISA